MDDKKKSGGVKGSKGGEILIRGGGIQIKGQGMMRKGWGNIDKGAENDERGMLQFSLQNKNARDNKIRKFIVQRKEMILRAQATGMPK